MLWVAITGGIACGKSAFASILRQKGYAVLNTDQLARDVTAPGSPLLNQLALHFGSWILNSKGELDRPQLFDKLFKSPDFKKELERPSTSSYSGGCETLEEKACPKGMSCGLL